ncbi:ABC transporter substrate-binding protein [Dermabacter jinjuensis]|uniref:Sugar ABC transporter substrate-binding protein n=1 Tax=Dermabacter jinjuensis TaxID=1667168 RepID=A0ABM6PP18_9MICO|nr:extracellular solute-binding protein [Dermabacter jinjuensis]ATH97491.1 sugar ABC transporter substrate-binding protein [Dermabacter jinjuensis]UEB89697.1 extracellular solute-binding protein [Dermabacter jinjuensis]
MATTTRRGFLAGMAGLGTLGALAGCGGSTSGGTSLEYFQFKSEAIDLFNSICEEYNAQSNNVRVRQNFQADNVTALRVRLVKNSMPDIVSINGDYNFGSIARSGVFYDFAKTDLLDKVQEGVGAILPSLGAGADGEVNGLPLSTNGSGMIYNKDIFDDFGIQPPKTWDDLIAAAEEFTAGGVDPFYWGFRDNWTGAPMFSSISGNFLPDVAEWYQKRLEGDTTFEDLRPVLEKMNQIAKMGNRNKYEVDYNGGNQGFAQGKAAIYVHGTYAIPAIRSYNPDINLGTFATPADDPADTRVVSGVDVALTMGVEPEHEEEALDFMRYLMKEENVLAYCKEQVAFPTLKGTETDDPALQGLQEYFANDLIATYSDHNFPQGVNLNNYMQQFLIDHDIDAFIKTLDTQWDKVAKRMAATA